MIDYFGRWIEEKDYKMYPKGKWCDMDYVASYIRRRGYSPKTTMENLINMIILHLEGEVEEGNFSQMYDKNSMINIENLSAFVDASGGLKEFDYFA